MVCRHNVSEGEVEVTIKRRDDVNRGYSVWRFPRRSTYIFDGVCHLTMHNLGASSPKNVGKETHRGNYSNKRNTVIRQPKMIRCTKMIYLPVDEETVSVDEGTGKLVLVDRHN